MKATFGWTVVAMGGDPKKVRAYKRDCPADTAHFAADLAPFTHSSKAKAIAAGKRGEYAYKKPAPVKVEQATCPICGASPKCPEHMWDGP